MKTTKYIALKDMPFWAKDEVKETNNSVYLKDGNKSDGSDYLMYYYDGGFKKLIQDGWIAEYKPKRYEYRGEYRLPKRGELFLQKDYAEVVVTARLDFDETKCHILHELPTQYSVEQVREAYNLSLTGDSCMNATFINRIISHLEATV